MTEQQQQAEQQQTEQVEQQRKKRERDKKQRWRANMTPERREAVLAAERERDAARRANMTAEARATKIKKGTARRQQEARGRPFIGVDLEGAGKNAAGQQNLVLLGAAGEGFDYSPLHKEIGGCENISSVEAFEWILGLPDKKEAILVSLFFWLGRDAYLARHRHQGRRGPL